jgi:hypothetical protein
MTSYPNTGHNMGHELYSVRGDSRGYTLLLVTTFCLANTEEYSSRISFLVPQWGPIIYQIFVMLKGALRSSGYGYSYIFLYLTSFILICIWFRASIWELLDWNSDDINRPKFLSLDVCGGDFFNQRISLVNGLEIAIALQRHVRASNMFNIQIHLLLCDTFFLVLLFV